MLNVASQPDRQQEQVNAYFQSSARYWEEIYETRGLQPQIYQCRQETALTWIAQLQLPPASRVLEIGCGAGLVSMALARGGQSVEAIDAAPAMVELARQNAFRWGVASRLRITAGNAHALPFAAERFDLVVALGVIPWLHSESAAIREMQRVLRPGAYLLLTADNECSLSRMLDPISTPALAAPRRITKGISNALGIRRAATELFQARRHSPIQIDRLLEACGLVKLRSKTLGFGPFTFCGRPVFPESLSIRINRELQKSADLDIAPLRIMGSHYVVLARKLCGRTTDTRLGPSDKDGSEATDQGCD